MSRIATLITVSTIVLSLALPADAAGGFWKRLRARFDAVYQAITEVEERVDAIDDDLASTESDVADHESRLAALEQGSGGLVAVDANGVAIGDVIPGTVSATSAQVTRDSGTYTLYETGFRLSRSLIYRSSSCSGPLVTVDEDFPGTEGSTNSFSPVGLNLATALPDGFAYVKAANSLEDEEGVATISLFIPDGSGGCYAWSTFDGGRVYRLILRDDLTVFSTPFKVVPK